MGIHIVDVSDDGWVLDHDCEDDCEVVSLLSERADPSYRGPHYVFVDEASGALGWSPKSVRPGEAYVLDQQPHQAWSAP